VTRVLEPTIELAVPKAVQHLRAFMLLPDLRPAPYLLDAKTGIERRSRTAPGMTLIIGLSPTPSGNKPLDRRGNGSIQEIFDLIDSLARVPITNIDESLGVPSCE
jgi:hypothetical protein